MDLASVKVKQKLKDKKSVIKQSDAKNDSTEKGKKVKFEKNKELPTWMDKPPETDKRHDPVMVDENGQKKKITLKQTVLEDDYVGSESDSDEDLPGGGGGNNDGVLWIYYPEGNQET